MADKDTIYVDIDDDITAIIDRVSGARHKVVALVLPKRAAAMQSLVNMKLLKRASEESSKNLVLVTSEAGLIPLAGAAGLHVAATPTSKPAIPKLPDSEELPEEVDEPADSEDSDFDSRAAENKPLGEIAGIGAEKDISDDDPIELDNTEPIKEPAAKKPKSGKNKKLKVPNFKKFRLGLVVAILVLIGLAVFIYFASQVWPHATIKIYTDQHKLPVSFAAKLESDANTVDASAETIPAVPKTDTEGYSQTVPATGQKDEGQKASGSVQFTKCVSGLADAQDIPAGTGVSTNNLTYITQDSAHFSPTFQSCSGGVMAQSSSVEIVAQQAGENYNVSNASFAVNGYPGVSAAGQASGGTTNIVRVVTQSDIDKAKQKLEDSNKNAIKQQLIAELDQIGLMPIEATFKALPGDIDTSAGAGDKAENVTVTENVSYVLFGVKNSDLKELIKANVKQQLDSGQGVLDTGLDGASYKLEGGASEDSVTVSINTSAIIGPKLDESALKKRFMGEKAGRIRKELTSQRGVDRAKVDLSPFWVGSVPKDPTKVTIEFHKSNAN